jgi:hypothetical protein
VSYRTRFGASHTKVAISTHSRTRDKNLAAELSVPSQKIKSIAYRSVEVSKRQKLQRRRRSKEEQAV